MYSDKEKIATKLYEIFDNAIVGGVNVDELLTPQQKYDLIMHILKDLPYTNLEMVKLAHDNLELDANTVDPFETLKLSLKLLKEDLVKRDEAYLKLITIFKEVYDNGDKEEYNIESKFKVLIKLLYSTYTNVIFSNVNSELHEGMLEYLSVRLSLIHNDIEEVKETVKEYKEVDTIPLVNNRGKFIVLNKNSKNLVNKIKIKFNIKDLIKHLKQ